MDVGGISYTVLAAGAILFVLGVGKAVDRQHQRNVNRGRWVDQWMRFDADHRLHRQIKDQAMWDAVAERDRRAKSRRSSGL